MSGSIDGGTKAAQTNKEKYGADFYAKIGAMGGKASGTGGFYADRDRARTAGSKGGALSKKGQRLIGFDENGVPQYVKKV